ncbi:MAG: hypothetical protein ACLSHC_11295 [Bilophila wadsworthia]
MKSSTGAATELYVHQPAASHPCGSQRRDVFAELDKMVDLAFEQLLERLEIQSCKK